MATIIKTIKHSTAGGSTLAPPSVVSIDFRQGSDQVLSGADSSATHLWAGTNTVVVEIRSFSKGQRRCLMGDREFD